MHEKILTLAKAIVRPAEEEEALLDALCTAAEAELTGRLREDVSPEDCGALMAPYWADDSFAFAGVRG